MKPRTWSTLTEGAEAEKEMDFLRDLWGFLRVRKKFWLLPIIMSLLLLSILIFISSGSAIAPFIYTIF